MKTRVEIGKRVGKTCGLVMTKYIEKRRRVYYTMLNIPEAVRPIFKKRKFLKSLETDTQYS